MILILPVILITASILFKVKLFALTLVVQAIFIVLNIVLIIFSRKILPDTTDFEYRKYLYTEGYSND